MNTFSHLCRSAAVALLAGLLACTGVVPALAATPKDLKITLPTEPVLVTPIAVSGKNLLVESDGRYRLSHDNGKHWITANVPFACSSYCSVELTGSVAGGVVATYSRVHGSIDAYSLVTNARVGSSYKVPDGHNVWRLTGTHALLYNPDTSGVTLLSLTTGATHEIKPLSGYRLNNGPELLPDGSVLLRNNNDSAPSWIRISPTGTVTPVFTSPTPTYLDKVSGNVLLFSKTVSGVTTYCLLTLPGTIPSCRNGVGIRLNTLSMSSAGSSAGILVEGSRHALRWYPIVGGRISASRPVSGITVHDDAYKTVLSAENAYPVIAQRNATSSWLKRINTGARSVTVSLGWARRPVDVTNLALSPTSILGSYGGDSSPYRFTWWRSADRTVGGQHRLNRQGFTAVAASGSRWATSQEGGGLRLYDRTRRTTSIAGPYNDNVVTQSGPYLLAFPSCSLPEGDPDASCDPLKILDSAGHTLVKQTPASDIFGTLAVKATDSTGKLTVYDFLDGLAPVVDITLPDPGTEGFYSDITIWGDWVAATKDSGRSSWQTVVHNYRTGVTMTAPGESALETLGDGFVVFRTTRTDELKLWNLADDKVTVLGPTVWNGSFAPVATDGSRVAFVKGGSLVIKTVAGAGKSAPRLLGVVAPTTLKGTWKAAIDLTKAVRSGRLEIRNSAGTLVRSLSVKASKDGSLRGITWNGRDKAGKRVPAGRYAYTLTNRAADGTGAIRLVDGAVGPIGTIQVP